MFILIGALIIICTQTPFVLIVVVILAIFFYFIQKKYRFSSREMKRLFAVNNSIFLTHISETSR